MTISANGNAAFTLPGMVNLHSHAFQRAMAGLTERAGTGEDTFWTWREVMYRFIDHLTPDDVEAIATLAYVEMLEAGYTRVCEFHYLHHDVDGRPYANLAEMAERIAAAAQATGIGLTLLPVLYSHGGFGGQPPVAGQRRFVNDTDRYLKLRAASAEAVKGMPGAIVGAAPHSLRAVTLDGLKQLRSTLPHVPIHIHVAEQEKEVADCLAWSGMRPVQWLLDAGLIDERWCLIHATHVTPDEVAGMAKSKAVVGLCPITEANLGDGIFPAVEFMSAGGRFGVGTDSNVLISLAEELRMLEYGQRLRDRRRNRMGKPGASIGRTLFEASLAGGHQAAGASVSDDRVVLLKDTVELAGRNDGNIIDGWIFASARSIVDEVWCGGKRVVEGGRHVARPFAERRYSDAMAKLAAV